MATTHYNFPTIVGTDTIDGVNAINGLANSVDSALFGVASDIPPAYSLPIAGTTSLGGVRGSGDISVNAGTGDMTINANTVGSNELQSGSVTNAKIALGAVDSSNIASGVLTNIQQGAQAYNTLNSSGQRTTISSGSYSDQNGFTATGHNGFYIDYPAAKLLVIKVNVSGTLNLSTNGNQPMCVITFPTKYNLPYSTSTVCGLNVNPADGKPVLFMASYEGNKLSFSPINYGTATGTLTGIAPTFFGIIPYAAVIQ